MKLITTLFAVPIRQFQREALIVQLRVHLYFALAYGYFAFAYFFLFVPTFPWPSFIGLVATYVSLAMIYVVLMSREFMLLRLNGSALASKRLMEFDDQGIVLRMETGSHSFTVWPDVLKIARKRDYTTIFLNRLVRLHVPDSAWPSSAELGQFLDLLRAKSLLK